MATLALILAIAVFHGTRSEETLKRSVGNELAGSDLYGIGVRTGLYLQGFAFAINTITMDTRSGILLASSVLQFSILASFSVLIRRSGLESLSPAEALLMLNMLSFSTTPTMCAIFGVKVGGHNASGHALGIGIFIVDSLWLASLLTWFWATGYRTLPSLGTPGSAFFYTRVSITGWFRILGLVLVVFNWIFILLLVAFGIYLWLKSIGWWWTKEDPDEHDWETVVQRIVVAYAIFFVLWALAPQVAAAEMIIRYNNLEPNNDLSSPGQLIPFVTGIVTLLDSVLGVCRHIRHRDFDWQE
jgi:hypothetical protein